MKQIYKQLISIILSVSLVGTSMPAYSRGKYFLAVPGSKELESSLVAGKLMNTDKGQSDWRESTKKALAKLDELKVWARPEEVRKNKYYHALTPKEWDKICSVEPEKYFKRYKKSQITKPCLKEYTAFSLNAGKDILTAKKLGKIIARNLREYSREETVVIPVYVDYNSEITRSRIVNKVILPPKFASRFGFRVLKNGLPVAILLFAQKDMPEARIDILRDPQTALITGFHIIEGDNPPYIHHMRALYRRCQGRMELIITKTYINDYDSLVEDVAKKETVFVKSKIDDKGIVKIMKYYELHLKTMSGMRLERAIVFVALTDAVPTDVLIPPQKVSRPGPDRDVPPVEINLPSIEIRGLKRTSILQTGMKQQCYSMRAFDELLINGETSSNLTRIFSRKPNGDCGKFLFAIHRESRSHHRDEDVKFVIHDSFPENSDFVVKNYAMNARGFDLLCLYWDEKRIVLPTKLWAYDVAADIHLIKKELNYFILKEDTGASLAKIIIRRDNKKGMTGIVVEKDGRREGLNYVFLEGKAGKVQVNRIYLPSQVRWPLKWIRNYKFTGTMWGAINIYDTEDERGGQILISGDKKGGFPARLFRNRRLLERPIELRFNKGELTHFYFPLEKESIPAKKWELDLVGEVKPLEWKKWMKKWDKLLDNIAKKEFHKHWRIYYAAGMRREDVRGIVDMIFITQIERLPLNEDIDKKMIYTSLQVLKNYPWKQIRELKEDFTDTQLRRLRRLYAKRIKAENEGLKLSNEEIKIMFSLSDKQLWDLLDIEKIVFGTLWQWEEPGGTRPDEDTGRVRLSPSPKSFTHKATQNSH